nr:PREDICTED: SH3 domain-containing YSC84-like protein 1 [Struthio camelus australis]
MDAISCFLPPYSGTTPTPLGGGSRKLPLGAQRDRAADEGGTVVPRCSAGPLARVRNAKVVDAERGHDTGQLSETDLVKERRFFGENRFLPTYYTNLLLRKLSKTDHRCHCLLLSCFTVNNPIPSNLKSEAKKAAKILREFTEITSRNGPDKIIPPHVIAKAKGLAVLSVIKAGFLVTARGGSGIVLARLPNGTWSAPSAIGIAGLGGGFEIGIEVSDLVIILNHERAVEAFAKGGNLTLGGNLTVAIGPLGRNLEGDVALRSSAAVYTYCKSRGLFAGVSLEGTCLIERKETNRKFYGQDIRASSILFGDVPFPAQAEDLYETLASFTEVYENEEQKKNPGKAVNDPPPRPSSRPEPRKPSVRPPPPAKKNSNKLYPELPNDYGSVGNSWSSPVEVTALYSFEGQQPGDLSFKAGDKITVTTKTNSQFDWWEGTIGGQTGIFPANYVAISKLND